MLSLIFMGIQSIICKFTNQHPLLLANAQQGYKASAPSEAKRPNCTGVEALTQKAQDPEA